MPAARCQDQAITAQLLINHQPPPHNQSKKYPIFCLCSTIRVGFTRPHVSHPVSHHGHTAQGASQTLPETQSGDQHSSSLGEQPGSCWHSQRLEEKSAAGSGKSWLSILPFPRKGFLAPTRGGQMRGPRAVHSMEKAPPGGDQLWDVQGTFPAVVSHSRDTPWILPAHLAQSRPTGRCGVSG